MKIHGLDFEEASSNKKEQKISRQTAVVSRFKTASANSEKFPAAEDKRRIKMKNTNIILIGIIVILMGALGWMIFKPDVSSLWSGEKLLSPIAGKTEVQKSKYQAVFLTNGQVYFGLLSGFPGNAPVIKDVYYLRAQSSLQPSSGLKEENLKVEDEDKKTEDSKEKTAVAQPELTLIKLGNELHGPVDEIKLNSDHILFVEELRSDSRIVRAIEQFKGR